MSNVSNETMQQHEMIERKVRGRRLVLRLFLEVILTGEMSSVVLLGRSHSLRLLGCSLGLLGQLVGLEREREGE